MDREQAIESRDNSKLKLARGVRDGRESSLIFVEGTRLVEEALSSNVNCRFLLASTAYDNRFDKLPELYRVEAAIFSSIADTENSQGIIAIAERPKHSLEHSPGGLVVLLHRVNNPSNLGAVVRTSEAAGAVGLITTNGAADAFSPKALRASMGSAFRLPIVERIGFGDAIEWARSHGLVTIAADNAGFVNYTDIDWTVPRLVVFGSEAHGLGERELELIDEKIVIPMENEVESLNLAVSSGIVLFEAKRQRDLS